MWILEEDERNVKSCKYSPTGDGEVGGEEELIGWVLILAITKYLKQNLVLDLLLTVEKTKLCKA